MHFRLLGPLSVVDTQGREVEITRPKLRTLLATLLITPNRLVPASSLVTSLWPEAPPESAAGNLKTYVWTLRRLLRPDDPAAAPLATDKRGYSIRVRPGCLDVAAFDRLVNDGHAARRENNITAAVRHFEDALSLWRGPAFHDIPDGGGPIGAEVRRLDGQRLTAIENLMEVRIAAGGHPEVIAELQALTAQHPLRERLWGLLMLALCRNGGRSQALMAYQRLRRHLIDELGLEPSPPLRAMHARILDGDSTLFAGSEWPGTDWPAPDPVGGPPGTARTADAGDAPRQLPPRPALFVGRAAELARLDEATDEGSTAIAVITGPGGVGKTWLALRWAYDNLDRFPDGQLYLNLRGFDAAEPTVRPEAAIRGLLDGLGVPEAAIPRDPNAQAALYRSRVAGKRLLILLDNGRDAEQVRPLLPGSAGCAVLVTSRDELASLIATHGAHPVAVDVIGPADARTLLARRLGERRLAAEPEATARIIARCGRLPIAMAMVAARAATRTRIPLQTFADELGDSRDRLDALSTGDMATDIRAVFSWSYRALGPDTGRFFRLLAIHPPGEIGVYAAASLAGVPVREAQRHLDTLARVHLVSAESTGRYGLHDLLRDYGGELTHAHDTETDRSLAVRRLLDHFLRTSHTACLLLDPHRLPLPMPDAHPDATPHPVSRGGQDALEWFTREHDTLVAAVRLATSAGLDVHAWQLAITLDTFFDRYGYWQDWVTSKRLALAAAERLGDEFAQAMVHCLLAEAYAWIGRHHDTEVHLGHATGLYQRIGDQIGLAYVHLCQGWVYEPQGRYGEALKHAEEALRLYGAADFKAGYANALNNVGWYHAQLGDYHRAVAHCREALTLQQQLGNRSWEVRSWDSLGYAHHHLGEHRESIACFRHALHLARDLGNRRYETKILIRMGEAQHAAGDRHAARHSWQTAATVLREIGHPDAEQISAKLANSDPDSGPAPRHPARVSGL